jgi:small subunit ribosomal protein S20
LEKITLANTPQARKRVRQAVKARTRNAAQKSNFRSSIKKVLKSLSEKNKDQSNANFKEAMSIMDKLVIKGLIHKNKAARHKSRLNKHIQKLS